MGEASLLHDSTLACLGDAELRSVALVSKEARKHALVFMSVATYKCVGVTGEATLAPLQLVDREDDARRGACRCAPSLTVDGVDSQGASSAEEWPEEGDPDFSEDDYSCTWRARGARGARKRSTPLPPLRSPLPSGRLTPPFPCRDAVTA